MASELNVGGLVTTGTVGVGAAATNPDGYTNWMSVKGGSATQGGAIYVGNTANENSLQLASWNGTGYIRVRAAESLHIGTSNSTRVTISAAGLATFSNGIAFQSATSSTESGVTASGYTLDKYEEGTWTAVIAGASGVGNTTGYYTRVGRLVTFSYYSGGFTSTAVGAIITGLPFVPSVYQTFVTTHNTWTPLSSSGYVSVSSGDLVFVNPGSTSGATATAGSGKYVMCTGTYFV